MSTFNTYHSKKLFGICDAPWRCKSVTSEEALYLWLDFVRMRDILTNCNFQIDKETDIAIFDWTPSQKSFLEISDKINKLTTIDEIAELALEETSNFVRNHSFDCGKYINPWALSVFQELSIKTAMKRYLYLVGAYEKSRIYPLNMPPKTVACFKVVATEILNITLKTNHPNCIKLIESTIKNITKGISNHINAIEKHRLPADNINYIYSWILGKRFEGIDADINYESIYDIILASAFLSTSRRSNPYALLLDAIKPDEHPSFQPDIDNRKHSQIKDEVATQQGAGRENDIVHNFKKKEFQKLNDLNNFLWHFSLRKITEELFDLDYVFTNLSVYFTERFSQINFINSVSLWAEKHGKTINDDNKYEKRILYRLISLSTCPLVEFRLNLLNYIYKIESSEDILSFLNKVYFLTDSLFFYTIYFLPLLQYVFKLFLSIFYLNEKNSLKEDVVLRPMFKLFSKNPSYDNSLKKLIIPAYAVEKIDNVIYNDVIRLTYHTFYESLTLPDEFSICSLLLDFSAQKLEVNSYLYSKRYYGKNFPSMRFDYYASSFFKENKIMSNNIKDFQSYLNSDEFAIIQSAI